MKGKLTTVIAWLMISSAVLMVLDGWLVPCETVFQQMVVSIRGTTSSVLWIGGWIILAIREKKT